MIPVDSKDRTILTEEQASVVAIFLAQVRGTLKKDRAVSQQDWLDTRQVLVALANAGWAIVPQGQLDGWKKIITENFEHVDSGYLENKEVQPMTMHEGE